MSTATLLAMPRAVFYDAVGNPLAGGFVHTYVPGGSTPKTTWQDAAETTPNSNPIVLDADGSCLLYGSGNYQITVTDALGNAVPGYSGLSADVVTEAGISAAMAPVVAAASTEGAVALLNYLAPATGAAIRTLESKLNDIISLKDFGVVGDGIANDAPAVQAAVNAALAAKAKLHVPAASVGYRIATAINLTDLNDALTIEGDGMSAPAFGLAITPPTGGSLFLGNTGAGKPVFDCSGSNNIIFRDLNINAIGQTTPSSIGILFATSTSSPSAQAPGGSNCGCENVAIYMPHAPSNPSHSVPIAWVSGAGLGHFFNVWTLGEYGIAISSNNILGLSSPYVTFGAPIGIDGIAAVGCSLLGYGGAEVLYIEASSNQTWDALYIATIFGGPSYAGQPYGMYFQIVTDIRIQVECDYFPSLISATGNLIGLEIIGTVFPSTTPIPVSIPIIAFFDDFAVTNCTFAVIVVAGLLAGSPYHYTTTGGGSPTISGFNNCEFLFDLEVSPNVFFGNAQSGLAVPFFNLRFNGNTDASGAAMTFEVNGSAASSSQYRYFMNGKLVGTG